MPSYWRHVNKVLDEAQIIIEVLDARQVNETRNIEIETKIRHKKKILLYVITKCDLVDIKQLRSKIKQLRPAVFISAKDHLGTTILKKKILQLSKGKSTIVGAVGYPNVGKSSLINALSGKGAAKTSSQSGYTKGMQKVKVDNKILILDTPGVFPHKEKDAEKHAKIGAIDYSTIKDPELAALRLIEQEKELIKQYYDVKDDDPEKILEAVGKLRKRLQKGGVIDLESAARLVLKDWQTGKIKQ
jgi:ribosome biogenesis GTPase A